MHEAFGVPSGVDARDRGGESHKRKVARVDGLIQTGVAVADYVLTARIRGEYREMLDLRLTVAEACRLWQIDVSTCQAVLQALVADGFLARTPDGAFIAMPTTSRSLAVDLTRVRERRFV